MRWQEVPMPEAVAKLPRDRRGYPIPWVSEWDEPGTALGIVWDANGRPLMGCGCTIGVGEPNLGALCPARQRAGMAHALCDVCGDAIGDGPYVFVGRKDAVFYTEPPLHYACATYSVQVCAAIRVPTRVFELVECKGYDLTRELLVDVNWDGSLKRIEMPMGARIPAANGAEAPTGFLHARPKDVLWKYSVPEWLEEFL